MSVLFLIATCERPDMLRSLLWQINAICPLPHKVCVVDDASEADYGAIREYLAKSGGWYKRLEVRNGRRRYWKTVNTLFRQARREDFDYVFKLDDDIILHPHAIFKAIQLHDVVFNYHKKVVINLWVDHRADKPIWTGITPSKTQIKSHLLRKVGWVDGGNWMTGTNTMEAIDYSCPQPPEEWWDKPGDSSGVGKYLSNKLSNRACRIYMPMRSLVYHGNHQSQMHADKENRLIEMDKKPWNNE